MYTSDNQTAIFALSTPVGGALAVIRISGGIARQAVQRYFSGRLAHRVCSYGHFSGSDGEFIDECTAVFFEAPHSYTGEDCVELTVHGSYAVVNAVLATLGEFSAGGEKLRPAQAGEFTKRAFLNGKMDLCRAEAVMDVICASTELALKAASEQLRGGLSKKLDALYNRLIAIASLIDATIDFPDEMDEQTEISNIDNAVVSVRDDIEALVKDGECCRILRDGARVVLIGRPNAGKSSLMNALLCRDRAIVAKERGTTRDTIEESTSFGGVPTVLVDTAGIRFAESEAEALGIERALCEAQFASLVLAVFDGSQELSPDDEQVKAAIRSVPSIAVITKNDLPQRLFVDSDGKFCTLPAICTSAADGSGLDALKSSIAHRLMPEGELPIVTNVRHIAALKAAASALWDCAEVDLLECKAADIRDALESIGAITGKNVSEDVIDAIFSKFCVGK